MKRSASRSPSLTINFRSSVHICFVGLNAIAHIQLSTLLEGLRTETEKPLQKSQTKFFSHFVCFEKEAKTFWRNLLPKTQAVLWLMCSFSSTVSNVFQLFSSNLFLPLTIILLKIFEEITKQKYLHLFTIRKKAVENV